MEYNIGDTVQIIESYNPLMDRVSGHSEMEPFCGKIMTIIEVVPWYNDEYSYAMEEDNGRHLWFHTLIAGRANPQCKILKTDCLPML